MMLMCQICESIVIVLRFKFYIYTHWKSHAFIYP